jgi:hypothetical protein
VLLLRSRVAAVELEELPLDDALDVEEDGPAAGVAE